MNGNFLNTMSDENLSTHLERVLTEWDAARFDGDLEWAKRKEAQAHAAVEEITRRAAQK